MTSLIRIILIIALIYFGVRFIDRFVIPLFSGNKKKDNDNDTTISGSGKKKKIFNKDDGEYIDYEEVE
jgi:hypothetical protein